MNEDVYVDYLSIGAPMDSNFTGLRKISPAYYKDRARLDGAKFSPLALNEDTFNGVGTLEHNGGSIESNVGLNGSTDFLSKEGYSYLTPSIVEFSDPSDQNKSFNFYYTAFTVFARDAMNEGLGGTSVHSNLFNNLENYERVLVSLLNYNKNKQNYIDSDTTNPYFWKSGQYDPMAPEGEMSDRMETRDAYKRAVEQTGLTLHDPDKYSSFFNKEAGASKEKISSIDVGETYPLKFDDFSDGNLFLDDYLRFYMPAVTTGIPSPAIRPYVYNASLPNSFKYYWIHQDYMAYGHPSILNTLMNNAYGSYGVTSPNPTPDNDYAPLFFFNTNLTAKVEVFRGAAFPKDDENSWSLLKINDINLTLGPSQSRFLCRIVLYDEKFSQKVKIPVVDKYFLLDMSGIDFDPPAPPVVKHPDSASDWERPNYERIRDFRTLTEKGIRDTRRRDPLKPPAGARPDPDPSNTRRRHRPPDRRGRVTEPEQSTGRRQRADTPSIHRRPEDVYTDPTSLPETASPETLDLYAPGTNPPLGGPSGDGPY